MINCMNTKFNEKELDFIRLTLAKFHNSQAILNETHENEFVVFCYGDKFLIKKYKDEVYIVKEGNLERINGKIDLIFKSIYASKSLYDCLRKIIMKNTKIRIDSLHEENNEYYNEFLK